MVQAGYRGMRVREEDSGTSSPEDSKVTVRENIPRAGVDSGVGNSFSSREATPRDNDDTPKSEDKNYNEEKEDLDSQKADEEEEEEAAEGEEEGEEEDESEGSEDEEESEVEGEVVKGKTPFVLLKQLVGIMRLSGGIGKLRQLNDIPKVEVPSTENQNDTNDEGNKDVTDVALSNTTSAENQNDNNEADTVSNSKEEPLVTNTADNVNGVLSDCDIEQTETEFVKEISKDNEDAVDK